MPILKNCPLPVTFEGTKKILKQMENCICKVFISSDGYGFGTGFFCIIPYKGSELKVLITAYHILDKEYLLHKKEIKIELNNQLKVIDINDNRKIYSNYEFEITIIEINPYKDKIKDFLISKIEVDRNILVFLALLGSGILLLIFSLIFIPTIIISPAKFSMCFSLGSLLFLISFLFLYGTKKYMEKIFSKERFWITIMFIVSILIGCGFAIGKNYLISLICSIFQFISLILFILTFLPGGKLGIKCIKDLLTSPVSKLWMKMAESQINQ